MPEAVKVPRVELYRQVWAEPMIKLAFKYGLSDVGLAKLCKRNNIPCPPRGYWARKQAGDNPEILPLPSPEMNDFIEITPTMQNTLSVEAACMAESELIREEDAAPIVVQETLHSANPLVSMSMRLLEMEDKNEYGLIYPPARNCLDVVVSKDSRRRALLIMNALLKAFEARGYHVAVADGKEIRGTVVELLTTRVSFGIREGLVEKKLPVENQDKPTGGYSFHFSRFKKDKVPSGELSLLIDPHSSYTSVGRGCRRKWTDGSRGRLEDYLNSFVVGVVQVAAAQLEDQLEAERRHKAMEEEHQRAAELEARRKVMWEKIQREKSNVETLRSYAQRWEESNRIRAYVEAVRQSALAQGKDMGEATQLGQWFKWAEVQADRLDPLKENPPSILDEEEKYKPPTSRW